MECTSFVSISASNGLLKAVRYNMKHTHPVSQELAILYPKRRKVVIDKPPVSLKIPPKKPRHLDTFGFKEHLSPDDAREDYALETTQFSRHCAKHSLSKRAPELSIANYQHPSLYSSVDCPEHALNVSPMMRAPIATVQIVPTTEQYYPINATDSRISEIPVTTATSQRPFSCLLIRPRPSKLHNRRKTAQDSLYEPPDSW